jgi:hypothetical protein
MSCAWWLQAGRQRQLTNRQVMKRCDTDDEERLIIRLDNRTLPNHSASTPTHPWGPGFVHVGTLDPDCDFVKFVKNEGKGDEEEVDACDIVELKKVNTLTVHFSVTVPAPAADRHLGGYWMTVHHGESLLQCHRCRRWSARRPPHWLAQPTATP